jgi:hypothetical protein
MRMAVAVRMPVVSMNGIVVMVMAMVMAGMIV